MRFLLLLATLLAAPVASAQAPFFSTEFGRGSNGGAARVMGGVIRMGPVTPTLRLALTAGASDIEVPDTEPTDRVRQEGNVELGVGVSRVMALTERIGVSGGVGVAFAVASTDEVDPDADPFFSFPDAHFGVTMPLDVQALVKLSPAIALSAGAYWSLPLASGSSEDDPALLARQPSLEQSGVVVGLRVGAW